MYYKPLPTQARIKEVYDYNPETGLFRWKISTCGRARVGSEAGAKGAYATLRVDGILYYAQRLAWMYMTGEDPGGLEIDHKDNNKHNNKFSNLRKATGGQNQGNSSVRKDNKTGYKGVHKFRNKYRAQIKHNGRTYQLGSYNTAEEAHKAYCEAADKCHGEYANYG